MFRTVRERHLKISGLGSKNFLSSVFCSFFPFLLSFLLFFLPLPTFPSFPPFSFTSFLFSSSSPSSPLLPLPPFSSSYYVGCLEFCMSTTVYSPILCEVSVRYYDRHWPSHFPVFGCLSWPTHSFQLCFYLFHVWTLF